MSEAQLEIWTQKLVASAVSELNRGPGDWDFDDRLIGSLMERVGAVLRADSGRWLRNGSAELAEEVALNVYLTTLIEDSRREVTPYLLVALSTRLKATLAALSRESRQETNRGGIR